MFYKSTVLFVMAFLALLSSSPADASIFKKIGHLIKKSERTIGHVTMNGVRGIGRGEKAAMHFVGKELRTAERAVSSPGAGNAVLLFIGQHIRLH